MSEQAAKIRAELSKLTSQQKWLKGLHWMIAAILAILMIRGIHSVDSGLFMILSLCVCWLGALTQSFHNFTTTLSDIMLEQLDEVV